MLKLKFQFLRKKISGLTPETNFKKLLQGFTLIELMVSVTIFTVVMTMCLGSIVSIFSSYQKAKNLRTAMDNLNLTLESMTRSIRFGKNYHCGTTNVSPPAPADCSSGSSSFTFTDVKATGNVDTIYSFSSGRISRTTGGTTYYLTAPDIVITSGTFRVYGSLPFTTPDLVQPEVVIVISGYVGTKVTTRSTFTLQTTISQRLIDFQ